ncbi:TPM domain-containing protein [Salidesulfovibrio onnuriiensis]|uniref:TPM domain-containing protein n=1 Tax=Salidesulfovibrio onnuriiensis TaxID=2583823 RepID=UPI0011CA27ED|nr:TPM domain-containing protein [Salidesulfovibrio onnuriiensis]
MIFPAKTAAVLCTAALVLFTALSAFALDVPALKGRVNDYANMITPKAESQLNEMLAHFEASDSTQFVVLTVPSLEGDSLEDFSMRVAEAWKVGHKGKDNGALLVVSEGDHKMRIEVGYGLEGVLTDVLAGQIVDNVIAPEFKQGRYDDGFLLGAAAMVKAARGEFKGSGLKRERRSSGGSVFRLLFLLFFLPIWAFGFMGRHSRRGRSSGSVLPWIVLGSMMGGSSRSSGGFGGGGFGGGGFGGFSGGGGGFGGGGASGGW